MDPRLDFGAKSTVCEVSQCPVQIPLNTDAPIEDRAEHGPSLTANVQRLPRRQARQYATSASTTSHTDSSSVSSGIETSEPRTSCISQESSSPPLQEASWLSHFFSSLVTYARIWEPLKYPKYKGIYEKIDEMEEKDYKDYPAGLPRRAAYMNSPRRDNVRLHRIYSRSCGRVLEHRELEIFKLQQRLDKLDLEDEKSAGTNEDKSFRLRGVGHEERCNNEQKNIIDEVQEKFRVYYDLLLKFDQINALKRPPERNFYDLIHWMFGHKCIEKGQDEFMFVKDDFISISGGSRVRSHADDLIEMSMHRIASLASKGHGNAQMDIHFSRTIFEPLIKLISVVSAVLLLLLPSLILYLIPMSKVNKAVTVAVCVLPVATVFSVFNSGSSAGIGNVLHIVAAYMAVLIVFLGNSQNGCGCDGMVK